MSMHHDAVLEAQISEWRTYAARRPEFISADVDELESHLREEVETLTALGLAPDEAFLVGVRRMGALDVVAREFAREHSERVWKQLMLTGDDREGAQAAARTEALVAVGLAIIAAAAFKLPTLFGYALEGGSEGFYLRNLSLFVLPALTAFLAWKRGVPRRFAMQLTATFAATAVLLNVYPFRPLGATQLLAALHAPIALWLVVGITYTGNNWADGRGRMNFVRFTGELAIYYALIAFGGMIFTAFTQVLLAAIGLRAPWLAGQWIVPCGAIGAVLISAWLVEAKQSVIENMAPVLTRVFTPLFVLLLLGFLATMIVTGRGFDVDRNVLISVDLLLVAVLGLVLYAISARDPLAPPDAFDALQLVLILGALVVDVMALGSIATRISAFGVSANKIAALGENLVLLVNLGWSSVLYWRFLRRRSSLNAIEYWQTSYLPVYAGWAVIVVVVFPPLFGWA